MKEFLEYLLKNLAKYPDEASIREETTDDGTIVFYLKVHPDDIGKIIGKGGKVIWSIRTLLRVRAQQEGQRTLVKLEEPPPDEVPQEEIVSPQEDSQPASPPSDQSVTSPTPPTSPQPELAASEDNPEPPPSAPDTPINSPPEPLEVANDIPNDTPSDT